MCLAEPYFPYNTETDDNRTPPKRLPPFALLGGRAGGELKVRPKKGRDIHKRVSTRHMIAGPSRPLMVDTKDILDRDAMASNHNDVVRVYDDVAVRAYGPYLLASSTSTCAGTHSTHCVRSHTCVR
jgi:hypothetical protein